MEQIFICQWYRNLQIQSKSFWNCGNNLWQTFQKNGQQIIWKETGFNRYFYVFSVDYDATDVDDIFRHSQIFDEKK